jgi:hypothetical protein
MWVPNGTEILVKVGDDVKGGSSVLARLPVTASGRRATDQRTQDATEALTAGKQNS